MLKSGYNLFKKVTLLFFNILKDLVLGAVFTMY